MFIEQHITNSSTLFERFWSDKTYSVPLNKGLHKLTLVCLLLLRRCTSGVEVDLGFDVLFRFYKPKAGL